MATLLSSSPLSHHWSKVIKRQTKLKDDAAILSTYSQMESLRLLPDSSSLPVILKACAKLHALEMGKRIHDKILDTDLMDDVRVRTALVHFYCKCGFVEDARRVFDELSDRDVVLWNAMVSGYVENGHYEEGMRLCREMGLGLRANTGTVVALLQASGEGGDWERGREVHCYCLRNGLINADVRVGTSLIGFYLKFNLQLSRVVFESISLRNVVCWNAMIGGYVDAGEYYEALKLFEKMVRDEFQIDFLTLLAVIQACSDFGSVRLGMAVHSLAIKYTFICDLFIVNALVNMYSNNGGLEFSHELFKSVNACDVALWNSMISSYRDYGLLDEASNLFNEMRTAGVRLDERTIVIMLSTYTELTADLRLGRSLHAHVIKNGKEVGVSLGNALLKMYADLNSVGDVKKVFSKMEGLDVISVNTLMLALARNHMKVEAWECFGRMSNFGTEPNCHSVIAILAAFEDESSLNAGRSLHGYVIKHGMEMLPVLASAFADMYINCGDEEMAKHVFEGCPDKDVMSWNALMSSYLRHNEAHKALQVFNRMILEMVPNHVTILNVLSACTSLANLPLGLCSHTYILKKEPSWERETSVANALMTMYAKCGKMQYAENIFKKLKRKDVISWNAVIAGYGSDGRTHDAMLAFYEMLEEGFQPTAVTFVSLLSACSHSGLVETGLQLFHSMIQDFSITPELNHFGCMVDLLGRKGHLNEARYFIQSMPMEPDASIWRSLLSACRDHQEVKLAESIFNQLIQLEPMNVGNYVLLSNIYATANLWSEVKLLWDSLNEKGLAKPPGLSWIVIKDQVHSFTSRDESHPETDKIYAELNTLTSLMIDTGYIPDLHWSLRDECN